MVLEQRQLAILFDFINVQVYLLDRLGSGTDLDAQGVADLRLDQVFDRGFDGAEKSRVWRSAGVAAMIRLMVGRKPISSIRSASSSTRIRTPAR